MRQTLAELDSSVDELLTDIEHSVNALHLSLKPICTHIPDPFQVEGAMRNLDSIASLSGNSTEDLDVDLYMGQKVSLYDFGQIHITLKEYLWCSKSHIVELASGMLESLNSAGFITAMMLNRAILEQLGQLALLKKEIIAALDRRELHESWLDDFAATFSSDGPPIPTIPAVVTLADLRQ